jgi:signal transduction histidine kinase/ActR/RegA family two-component response regulator
MLGRVLGDSDDEALVAGAKPAAGDDGRELLTRWRAKMLRGVLVTSTLSLIPAVLIQLWQAVTGTAGVRNGMFLAIGAIFALAALTYVPISHAARSATLVVIGYVLTAAAIILEGFAPAQFVSVCMLIVLCVLFYSLRVAFLMLVAIAVSMALAASLYEHELIAPLNPAHLDVHNPLNWLRVGMYTLFPSAVAAIATNYLIEQLQETLRAREATLLELQSAQARLLHAQKLQAIGQLAAGIAHDFNNTLSVVALEAELLKQRAASAGGPETTRAAESLLAAAERGTQLSRQLLLFGRAETSERGVIDAVSCVQDCVRTLQRLLPTEIVFDVELSREPMPVRIRSGELQQIVLNLGINARDAMPRGGTLRIELSEQALDARAAASLHIAPGRYVRLLCGDSGTGMDEATLARAFEPFFTTKGIGRGTGLGLTNVWNIAQRAGGAVDVKSARDQGTTLWVYVPLSDAPIAEHVPSGSVRPPALASETVLVVEDDIRIRALLVTTFSGAGYNVLDACDADAALVVEREHKAAIHLLCTDVVMPGSPVRELIDHFRAHRPSTGIMVCSGYSEDEQIARGVARGELTHLEKPFTGKALLQKARVALDRAQAASAR